MGKRAEQEELYLKDLVRQRFGEEDKDVLEEHLAYIDREKDEADYHKNKHFKRAKIIRWAAFGTSISGGVLAYWVTETVGNELPLWLNIVLKMFSIWGPILIALLEDSRDTEENRETWIRHIIYVNNCMNECLEYVNNVKKYAGKSEGDAKRILLENLVEHRENNDRKFGENMNK